MRRLRQSCLRTPTTCFSSRTWAPTSLYLSRCATLACEWHLFLTLLVALVLPCHYRQAIPTLINVSTKTIDDAMLRSSCTQQLLLLEEVPRFAGPSQDCGVLHALVSSADDEKSSLK